VYPDCYDAHLATGMSQYVIGNMRGHYLASFARILLAIGYVREKDQPQARALWVSLRDEFPQHPLFTQEIAHLDTKTIVWDPAVSPSVAWGFTRNLQFCNHPVTNNIEPRIG
jgi:hypothetical protein